jgi:hypothetical protein
VSALDILGVASTLFFTCMACWVNEIFFSEESGLKVFTNRILFIIAFCEILEVALALVSLLKNYIGSII